MYKRNEKEWIGHLGCIALDLLGFQAAYLLSYFLLHWYIDFPNRSFFGYHALIILIIQLSASMLIESYGNILQRDNGTEMLHVVRTNAVVRDGFCSMLFAYDITCICIDYRS